MTTDGQAPGGVRLVTVAREYGSGGGEIARRLATRLGWNLLDHEIVAEVARRRGLTEPEAEGLDEHGEGFVGRLLIGMEYSAIAYSPIMVPENVAQEFQRAVQAVLLNAATLGRVVVVGRGGQFLFADRRDALHVGVVAPLPARIAYVMQREGLTEPQARARTLTKDRDRARSLEAEYRQSGHDVHLYDLVVNTGVLDLDSAVDLIALALERKAARLGVPAERLGPAAGLPRYETPPAS